MDEEQRIAVRERAKNLKLSQALARIADSEKHFINENGHCPLCDAWTATITDSGGKRSDIIVYHNDDCPFQIARNALLGG